MNASAFSPDAGLVVSASADHTLVVWDHEIGEPLVTLFMSLIHTCELEGVNPFAYLTAPHRHADALAANPTAWLPWNHQDALAAVPALGP